MVEEDFSKRLKKAMEFKNIKAAELSKMTNISPPMISDYQKGKYKSKQDNIYTLSKALDINEAWLMGYDVSMERIPDSKRVPKDEILQQKIDKLSEEQKDIVINIIDNMK